MKRTLAVLTTLLLTATALAQTTPELFIFKPGAPILADEMNANFQLLRDHVTNALGIADLTNDDLEELANLVEQLETLVASGELHGTSLEYVWDGTRLGIKRDNEEAFTYVELQGATGPQGEAGPGLEYEWDGTRLGVRASGQTEFTYVDLTGPQGTAGERGETGDPGPTGHDGADGVDGADGRNLEFHWNGTQLGVRYEGDTTYTYTDLQGQQGPEGPEGPEGIQGARGERGLPGPGLEFNWDGTRLGVKTPEDAEYSYVNLQGGPGPAGTPGSNGLNGADGRTLLSGTNTPTSSLGQDGDFYINTTTWQIHGPKTNGAWGAGVSLVGPTGQGGTNYTAGTGISIVNDTISLPRDQTLPTCWGGQVPQFDGYGWVCAPSVDTYFGPSSITATMDDGKPSDCVLGDVWLTANTYGSATIADGRLLSVNQDSALYSLIGTRYGGDGIYTFALPDLTHASPRSANGEALHYVICTEGHFPHRN